MNCSELPLFEFCAGRTDFQIGAVVDPFAQVVVSGRWTKRDFKRQVAVSKNERVNVFGFQHVLAEEY